jgi:hypothetical protein
VRVISLDDVALMTVLADGSPSATEAVRVRGKLETVPEDKVPGLACTEQGVRITLRDGAFVPFCPKGGAGFEIGDDGKRTYRFTSLDGESILVAVDGSHLAQRVEYQGEVVLACSTYACGSVHVSPPDSAGARIFTFTSTTLSEPGAVERGAELNGTLIVPAL